MGATRFQLVQLVLYNVIWEKLTNPESSSTEAQLGVCRTAKPAATSSTLIMDPRQILTKHAKPSNMYMNTRQTRKLQKGKMQKL